MVDVNTIVVQLVCDTTIPVSAMMFMIYLADMFPYGIIAIRLSQALCVIIEC